MSCQNIIYLVLFFLCWLITWLWKVAMTRDFASSISKNYVHILRLQMTSVL